MPELWNLQFGLVILATFVASAVSTSVGFGFGITLVSLLQFFISPVQIVGLGLLMSVANYLMRVLETRHTRTGGVALRVTLSGVLGVPLGVWLLGHADPLFLKRFFSVAIIAATVLLILAWRRYNHPRNVVASPRSVQVLSGALGGFMSGSANLGGFTIVLCSLVHDWNKALAHAVFSRYFLATTSASIMGMMLFGLYDRATVWAAFLLLPVVWVGHRIGLRLRAYIPEEQFRRYLMIFLAVLAVIGFVNTLWPGIET